MVEQSTATVDTPRTTSAATLNWLRAGVLGAGDGIVSTAGLVIGVAAATTDLATILTAGFAGLAAGAMSMAVGEYVSVSTQRDSERAMGIAPEQLTNPWHAAWASLVAFTVGAALPLVAMGVSLPAWRVPATVVSVLVALFLTGWVSATLGRSSRPRAVARNVVGGFLAMVVTYAIGALVGAQI